MVEKTIEEYNSKLGKYQLWKKLPKKMMYQTFQVILKYLEKLNKITVDKDGKIKEVKLKEDWIDFDKLNCIKCDRFVESVNEEGLCPECAEEECHQE